MQLSQTAVTAIIVACASVGGILLLLVLWSVIRGRKIYSPVPLPPKQPLAHHREQQLTRFSDRTGSSRPTTWYNQPFLQPPHGFPHTMSQASGSNASLLPNHFGHSPGISERSNPLESASLYGDMMTPPVPSFHTRPSPSSSSIASSDAGQDSPITPSSSLPTPRPRPRTPSSSRPISRASSYGTNITSRSTRTMRGAPHSIYSNVQIVLPAPLAPQVQSYLPGEGQGLALQSRRDTFIEGSRDRSSRYSMVDKWAPATTRTIDKERRRSVSAVESRTSTNSNHRSSTSFSSSRTQRRVSSGPISIHIQSTSRDDLTLEAPPVPRIPSRYGTPSRHQTPEPGFESEQEQEERGRTSSITKPFIDQVPNDLPNDDHKGGKLRKRSRSQPRSQEPGTWS